MKLYKKTYQWNVAHDQDLNLDLEDVYFMLDGLEYRLSNIIHHVLDPREPLRGQVKE
jgi:hypothetical protein